MRLSFRVCCLFLGSLCLVAVGLLPVVSAHAGTRASTLAIEEIIVRPNTTTNTLSYQCTLVNTGSAARQVRLAGVLQSTSANQKWSYPALPPQMVTLEPQSRRLIRVGPVVWTPGRASWWWPNIPFRPDYRATLHSLRLRLESGGTGTAVAAAAVRFGFCTPGQKDAHYTLNGVRFNLRGDNLHAERLGKDAFARLPGFLPPAGKSAGWPGSVRNYQRLGINVLKISGAPPTPYMLDVCDQLGMPVILEPTIGRLSGEERLEAVTIAYLGRLRDLIREGRNRPCVFKWSLVAWQKFTPEPLLRSLHTLCAQMDGRRPCSVDQEEIVEYPGLDIPVIERSNLSPDSPEFGTTLRLDRPFGQSGAHWPAEEPLSAPVWLALRTRALRERQNADIRLHSLIEVWPAVIEGLTPRAVPTIKPPSPDVPALTDRYPLDPVQPWTDPRIQLLQRSFAPVAVYDRDFDRHNLRANGRGEWPVVLPILPAGQTVTRQLVIFNDEFAGQEITARVVPMLHPTQERPRPLTPWVRKVTLAPGETGVFAFSLPVPTVQTNTRLSVSLIVEKAGQRRYKEVLPFVVAPAKGGTTVGFMGRDDKTQGSWVGTYGSEGFLVPIKLGRSAYAAPGLMIRRGTGLEEKEEKEDSPFAHTAEEQHAMVNLEDADTVEDVRIAQRGPGLPERVPTAFRGEGGALWIRVDSRDDLPRRFSLYLLDYKREGKAVDVDLFDLQGHRLDSRRISDFGDGAYLRYRITGSVLARMTPLTPGDATLSGVFLDPASDEEKG